MSSPMALVTGAASGIGLALTHHLLSKSYRVIMADLPSSSGSHLVTTLSLKNQVIFLPTDVSSWSSQLELFKQAYEWNGGRLDVLFSNAGVADVANLAEVELQEDEHGDLKNPDLRPLDVNLVGTIYAVMLFKHFVKKSRRDGGKVVITASGAGQYGMPSHPVYCASKHGVSSTSIARRGITKASSLWDLHALSV
jgi:15-hydroxyprostaglandin dehydrogenase (NAD)